MNILNPKYLLDSVVGWKVMACTVGGLQMGLFVQVVDVPY